MTLVKTCHGSNVMQVIWCSRLSRSNSYCDRKSCLNRDVSLFHYWIGRKLNLILKLIVATHNK